MMTNLYFLDDETDVDRINADISQVMEDIAALGEPTTKADRDTLAELEDELDTLQVQRDSMLSRWFQEA